ncbi:MAG: hypothetical protein AAFY19_00750 [Pseudomonadota bacterium]
MTRPHSRRDRERVECHAAQCAQQLRVTARALRLDADAIDKLGASRLADANRTIADTCDARAEAMEKALRGERTGFDYAGGRGRWLETQEKETA